MQRQLKRMRRRCGHVRRSRGPADWADMARQTTSDVRSSGVTDQPLRGWSDGQSEVPRDHQALHLAGALADLEDLGVAVLAGDERLVHEAVAAEHLRRV